MNTERRHQILFILLLSSGFLAGSALPELLHMGNGTYAGFLSLYSLQKYQTVQAGFRTVFSYVLSARLQPLVFLWMSSFTAAGLLFHAVYIWWLMAAAGMLLALFVLKGGPEGVLQLGCCLFPQWILYSSMWKREGLFLIRQQRKRRQGCMVSAEHFWQSDLLELMKLASYGVLGAVIETFLGKWTVHIFLGF